MFLKRPIDERHGDGVGRKTACGGRYSAWRRLERGRLRPLPVPRRSLHGAARGWPRARATVGRWPSSGLRRHCLPCRRRGWGIRHARRSALSTHRPDRWRHRSERWLLRKRSTAFDSRLPLWWRDLPAHTSRRRLGRWAHRHRRWWATPAWKGWRRCPGSPPNERNGITVLLSRVV